ncbi:MAG TPA: UDP-2,3-diacylglucosamine diphosphatase [Thermoanaerobaculia bacterium]|nr:UDP-2,3-diacylglucosamine diphosphatase [Thermoanaerobaculia bacterium]
MIPHDQIFIIGDSHIGLSEGSEEQVVEWLDRLAAHRPRALYLNGDVFHYLIAHPKFRTSPVEKFLARLRRLRDEGAAVHYVEGNRDFFLEGSFVEESVTDVGREYEVRAGRNRYLVVHGDMINDRDWPYRFWRRVSKNPLTKLSVTMIPQGFARRFVDRIERRLAQSNFKHKTRLPVELMEAYGRRRGRDGFTHVVFGHFHQKLVLPANGTTIAILPAWYESGEAMMIDPAGGDFSFVRI